MFEFEIIIYLQEMSESILLSDPKELMKALVLCLDSLMSQCESVQGQPSVFDIKNKPTITFPNYLMRIFSFMGCSLSAYIYSLILLDKIQQDNPTFKITHKNIHRLLFTAIVVAAKFVDDKYYNNSYYTKVGGIPLQTLNVQEETFMQLINYHCTANPDVFNSYLERLEKFNATITQEDTEKLQSKFTQAAPITQQTQQPKQGKRQIREKRERSRDKNIQRNYQTQESRQIEPF